MASSWHGLPLLGLLCLAASSRPRPNIVLILTDDQDSVLGGTTPLVAARRLLKDAGVDFSNAFVTTPICCPSRASILTGRYLHNTEVRNNTVSGGCSGPAWRDGLEGRTFATRLQDAGYLTMYAGKYLNQYGSEGGGGVGHVPKGWNWWAGLVGNSRYYNYTLSINGKVEKHGDTYSRDYLTDVIRRKAVQFLDYVSKAPKPRPFLMVLSPPACHAPFTPAPQYSKRFQGERAPRTPAFNRDQADDPKKHWLVQTEPRHMSNKTVELVDEVFRNRWRTLLSVDDLVLKVHHALETYSMLNDTYILFTSDHGYHLGQFGMPLDKRLPYEFDIRVPFWISGPNISSNQTVDTPVLSIDIAPTLLDLAGLPPDPNMDGLSFLSLVTPPSPSPSHRGFKANSSTTPRPSATSMNMNHTVVEAGREASNTSGITEDYPGIEGRRSFLVEYQGEGSSTTSSPACSEQLREDLAELSECDARLDCKCQDARNNTYACVRTHGQENSLFCRFDDSETFLEMYGLYQDEFQLTNIAGLLQEETRKHYLGELDVLKNCKGRECNNV